MKPSPGEVKVVVVSTVFLEGLHLDFHDDD